MSLVFFEFETFLCDAFLCDNIDVDTITLEECEKEVISSKITHGVDVAFSSCDESIFD